MEIEFNENQYIEQILVSEEIKKLESEIEEISGQIHVNELMIKVNEEKIYVSNEEQNKLKTASNYIFKYRRTKNKIKSITDCIESLKKETDDYKTELEKLKEMKENSEKRLQELKLQKKYELPSVLTTDGEQLTIDDSVEIKLNENINQREKEVIVHCTDFFPKNKKILCTYDGNKYYYSEVEYQGVSKECLYLSHRHSCHFVRNNVVQSTSDGLGTWSQPKFIIIEPFEKHKSQFVSTNVSDAFTEGSVSLGNKPIMLVRSDIYNDVSPEDLQDYRIIKYKGDYVTCVQNALKLLGIPLNKTFKDTADHHHSLIGRLEEQLEQRNRFVNFVRNNAWDGKSFISLNETEIFEIYGMDENNRVNKNVPYITSMCEMISKKINIPSEFIIFIIQKGIKKQESRYIFLDDEELYNEYKKIKQIKTENEIELLQSIDVENIKNIYDDYLNYKKNKQNSEKKSEDKKDEDMISKDILDIDVVKLNLFENMKIAKIIRQILIETIPVESDGYCWNHKVYFSGDGVKIEVNLDSNIYDIDSLKLCGLNCDATIQISLVLNGSLKEVLANVEKIKELISSCKKVEKENIENFDNEQGISI